MSLVRSLRGSRTWLSLGVALVLCNQVWAADWFEQGDAGQTIASAQSTSGPGQLDTIIGTLNNGEDVDVYQIYIPEPSLFSATTLGGDSVSSQDFDAGLALFEH